MPHPDTAFACLSHCVLIRTVLRLTPSHPEHGLHKLLRDLTTPSGVEGRMHGECLAADWQPPNCNLVAYDPEQKHCLLIAGGWPGGGGIQRVLGLRPADTVNLRARSSLSAKLVQPATMMVSSMPQSASWYNHIRRYFAQCCHRSHTYNSAH
jgi:hypothetical protein